MNLIIINLFIGLQIIYAQKLTKEDCKCRLGTANRIVGGNEAARNSIPWAISLAQKNSSNLMEHFCGASVINREYIITAKHCVQYLDVDKFIIRTGLHNLNEDPDPNNVYKPERIILDSITYKWGTLEADDIALVKINGKIKFNKNVQPACLATKFEHYDDRDKSLHAWGWGLTKKVIFKKDGSREGGGELSSVLKEAYLNYDRNCDSKNGICTKSDDGSSTCYADSGSGLQTKIENFVKLVGISSYTRFRKDENGDEIACERSGFTRVSNFLPVINYVTKGDYCSK